MVDTTAMNRLFRIARDNPVEEKTSTKLSKTMGHSTSLGGNVSVALLGISAVFTIQ